jgi:hypothetical protein
VTSNTTFDLFPTQLIVTHRKPLNRIAFQIQHSNDIEALNMSINLLNEQFYKEVSYAHVDARTVLLRSRWNFNVFTFQNIQKEEQLNLLRDANLQLRGQVFDLNQDIVDLLEIVESQKNRRMVSHFGEKLARDELQ